MVEIKNENRPKLNISENDKSIITEVFMEKMVPKLQFLSARIGTLNCEFAGKQYGNWIIHFRSTGNDFRIVDFEYDDETAGLDMDRVLPNEIK
ncbi:hypothetical protein ACFL2O_05115 [Thermodesulfobacteriota bacterium]